MGTGRHGQEGSLVPLWKCYKLFLYISSYSKTLSGRIIYALFSQPLVGLWGLCPQALHRTCCGELLLQTGNLLTPGKNPADTHVAKEVMFYRFFVCLSVCWQLYVKTTDKSFVKILPEMYMWTGKK